MTKTRKYHVLFGKNAKDSKWEMMFSDYVKSVVTDERDNEKESGGWYALKVVTLETDTHQAIIDKLAELNA